MKNTIHTTKILLTNTEPEKDLLRCDYFPAGGIVHVGGGGCS